MTLRQYLEYIYKWNWKRTTIFIDGKTRKRIDWNDLMDHMNRIILHIYPNEAMITLILGEEKQEERHE
mgnify:CR=1 FL=1